MVGVLLGFVVGWGSGVGRAAVEALPGSVVGSPVVWVHPPAVVDPLLEHRQYASDVLGRPVGYQVYRPPGYEREADRRYPVLYWLHDLDGDEGRAGLSPRLVDDAIRGGILPPLLVVYVSGGGASWFLNTADGQRPAETTFLLELVPHIDRRFRTVAGRGGRMVQGVGMGGHAALRLASAHPDRFCSGVAHGGDFRSASEFAASRELRDAFLRVFGGDTNRFLALQPASLARARVEQLRGRTGLMLAVGRADPHRVGGENLRRDLTALRLPVRWLEVDADRPSGVVDRAGLAGLEFGVSWLESARSADRDGPWVNPPDRQLPRVGHHVVYSASLDRPVGYSLYLPERATDGSGNGGARVPVVYHLHGRAEDESQHLETVAYLDAAIRVGEVPPMGWVWLYGGRLGWFMDSADGRVLAERVLLEEVMPHVEGRWGLGGGPGMRGLDGWGMGAWGALRLASTGPVRFRALLLHNPSVPDAATARERYLESWASVFGGDAVRFAGMEPVGRLEARASGLRGALDIRMVVGGKAVAVLPEAVRARDRLVAAGYRVEYEEVPGVGSGGPVLYPKTGLKDLRFLGRVLGLEGR